MAQPYIGEIRMFGGNFAPSGWAFCNGALMSIAENEVLFQLIGTTYGGDGSQTFAVPDLRGRVPIHMGTGGGATYQLAQMGGIEQVTLTQQELPVHSHPYLASSAIANTASPQNNFIAQPNQILPYVSETSVNVALGASSISSTGGNQPHDNMQPYLCISFIISLFGVFPSPT
ncbi:microcystin-dependent protein [Arcicella aurantiaca]|uniref:Microcystin-dependent protein n=1 Tax=Arcicella aurantiaca TaxID=591202 RepID=A0A316EEJ4_9BACT|nr:tail fiber protein [Arcicella aurantiaca]PWK29070.1 microcystin-dependent protein [Arcicella aurantiaca]